MESREPPDHPGKGAPMQDERAIPILPCNSIKEILAFYQALGFEVTYQQSAPNVYAAVRRRGIELHFFVLKGLDPTQSYSTCAVMVPDLPTLHTAFVEGLKTAFGKAPSAGVPRIARLRPGQTRFNVVDPGGNWVRFVSYDEADGSSRLSTESTRMARALETAATLRDSSGDEAKAAQVLDVALARTEPSLPTERARALADRAELALALHDPDRARTLLHELAALPLTEEERSTLRDVFETADLVQAALSA